MNYCDDELGMGLMMIGLFDMDGMNSRSLLPHILALPNSPPFSLALLT